MINVQMTITKCKKKFKMTKEEPMVLYRSPCNKAYKAERREQNEKE